MTDGFTILEGDSLAVLKGIPDGSVDTCVTSPPYWGLRCYGAGSAEIGREQSPLAYVAAVAAVFREVRRVLKPTGTLWLNLGDTYNGNKRGNTEVRKNRATAANNAGIDKREFSALPPKSLLGMPWRVAFALMDDGWVLRNDIIWSKTNPLPNSATDRLSSAHEHIFLFAKEPSGYYFNYQAIQEPSVEWERSNGASGGGGAESRRIPRSGRSRTRCPRRVSPCTARTGDARRVCPTSSTGSEGSAMYGRFR